ncbi:MAG: aminoacyl-tRNA hydrolase [Acholeplasmataceae bacterium]
MKLIIGLGNPGREYIQTRHNIGYIIIDKLLKDYNLSLKPNLKLKVEYVKSKDSLNDFILAKSLNYMNLSGESVLNIASYFKIDFNNILIIQDDISLPLGTIRFRENGTSGGQRGMEDIIKKLGTKEIKRLKIGIGNNPLIDAKDYVLGKLTKKEIDELMESFIKSSQAIKEYINNQDFSIIMTKYNTPRNNNI